MQEAVLVADIRGFAARVTEHGYAAASETLGLFAAVTREVVSRFDGTVVHLWRDEATALFSSAGQAIRAALTLKLRYGDDWLTVGIGLDAGEVIPTPTGYLGRPVLVAARLCSLAGPGEVLTRDGAVAREEVPAGVRIAHRGAVELRGIEEPVSVIELIGETQGRE